MVLDLAKAPKLCVGDVTEYERWRRDLYRIELIKTAKELYGDNIPPQALKDIQAELRTVKLTTDTGFDLTAAQWLFWKSFSKQVPTITMEEVGEQLESGKLAEYASTLFPETVDSLKAQKKTPRRRKPRTSNR